MKDQFEGIYKNKRVFLTGHTGFKGSWLLSWLHLLGAEVRAYALKPEGESDLYNTIEGDNLCYSQIADIRDESTLQNAILEFQPDFVFHLAAQPLVRLSYEMPTDTFAVNVMGTTNVLDALRYLKKPCVAVMITTDKVYHNEEKHYYYKETDRLGGFDPYSASKAAAEIVIDSYRKSFFNPSKYSEHQKSISVARAGNVIGGGDWAKDRIIPDIVRALSNSEPVLLRNPASVRPWQHVLEPLSGYLTLAAFQTTDPVRFADAFNFGPLPEDNLTVAEVASEAINIWGSGSYFTPKDIAAPHEAGLLQLNIDKATSVLHWKPRYTASQAIEETIYWYKEVSFLGNQDATMITISQIQKYNAI